MAESEAEKRALTTTGTIMSLPLPELDASAPTPLQVHLQQCTFATGAIHRLHCVMEDIGGFVASRIVSLLFVIFFLLAGILSLQFGST
jgi:hypothetical protein